MSSSSKKNDCSPACRTQRRKLHAGGGLDRWGSAHRAPSRNASALQARSPNVGCAPFVITLIGPALAQPQVECSNNSPWPTRGPNADLTFGSTMRGGGYLDVKEPCKWGRSEWFVGGRRRARFGLSRRRSRVRVPSCPYESPAECAFEGAVSTTRRTGAYVACSRALAQTPPQWLQSPWSVGAPRW